MSIGIHRLNGVENKIEDGAVQQILVTVQPREIGPHVDLDLHAGTPVWV
jgi:hypothetical protein